MIRFMRYKWLYFLISSLVIVPGIFSLVMYGFKPSIDFTGGTELELRVRKTDATVSEEEFSLAVKETYPESLISTTATKPDIFLIKTVPVNQTEKISFIAALKQKFEIVEEIRYETVGPVLGRELLIKTLTALILAAIGITMYVAYRFKSLKYGICAVLAMFHDTLVVLGIFSILGRFFGVEVDVLFVTALLTILSFSVHDTIVVYDRIRELSKKNSTVSYVDIVNAAVTETLSRSINNSMTIIFALLALWLLGGETIRWFVFALLIGTVTGTYSSTFTAAPLLVVWDTLSKRRSFKKK